MIFFPFFLFHFLFSAFFFLLGRAFYASILLYKITGKNVCRYANMHNNTFEHAHSYRPPNTQICVHCLSHSKKSCFFGLLWYSCWNPIFLYFISFHKTRRRRMYAKRNHKPSLECFFTYLRTTHHNKKSPFSAFFFLSNKHLTRQQ